MLSLKQELMQKRLFFTWMVLKLMEVLSTQGSHCRSVKKFHRLQKQFLLLPKEKHRKGRTLVLMLKRMDHRGLENLRDENLFHHHHHHHHGGDLLLVEEVNLPDAVLILPHDDV